MGKDLNLMYYKIKYKLNTIERYYSFMSQGNSFAPEFKDLRKDVQEKWIVEFSKHTKNEGV